MLRHAGLAILVTLLTACGVPTTYADIEVRSFACQGSGLVVAWQKVTDPTAREVIIMVDGLDHYSDTALIDTRVHVAIQDLQPPAYSGGTPLTVGFNDFVALRGTNGVSHQNLNDRGSPAVMRLSGPSKAVWIGVQCDNTSPFVGFAPVKVIITDYHGRVALF